LFAQGISTACVVSNSVGELNPVKEKAEELDRGDEMEATPYLSG
jgi:hypothetical protein